VISRHGIVATSQTLASQAGAQVLARGGSASDAAIAANAALGVVEPMSNGIGGDLFAIYWEAKTGKLTGINSSGWAAQQRLWTRSRPKGTKDAEEGIHSATGRLVGRVGKLHKKFGRLTGRRFFGRPFTTPTRDSRSPRSFRALAPVTSKLAGDEGARRLFPAGCMAPAVGEVFRNRDPWRKPSAAAEGGAAAFYKGRSRKRSWKTSDRLGGTLAAGDLSEFEPEMGRALSTDYRGWKIYGCSNGQVWLR